MPAEEITFRPLGEHDLPLLHAWIHRPHVRDWWGSAAGCGTLQETRSKYLPMFREESHVKPYIAMLRGEPIGFIQSYVAAECGEGWWQGETDHGSSWRTERGWGRVSEARWCQRFSGDCSPIAR